MSEQHAKTHRVYFYLKIIIETVKMCSDILVKNIKT